MLPSSESDKHVTDRLCDDDLLVEVVNKWIEKKSTCQQGSSQTNKYKNGIAIRHFDKDQTKTSVQSSRCYVDSSTDNTEDDDDEPFEESQILEDVFFVK